MIKFLKPSFFFLLLALSLELGARLLFPLLPLEVQQRYANLGSTSGNYQINGRGARGKWPQDHELKVALIGSSVLAMRELNDAETWTALLEKESPVPIHLDNYGVGFNKFKTAEAILESFQSQGLKYDIIIFQMSSDAAATTLRQTLSMSYTSNWMAPEGTSCHFCYLGKQFVKKRMNLEKRIISFFISPTKIEAPSIKPPSTELPKEVIYDRNLVKQLRQKGLLIAHDTVLPDQYKDFIRRSYRSLFKKALQQTPNVIWMPEGIFYHPNMKEYYQDLYIAVRPIKEFLNGPQRYFLSPQGQQAVLEKMNLETRQITQEMKIQEMNWLTPLNNKLPQQEGLFLDEFHLSATGSSEVANILKPLFYSYLQQLKNQSK